MSSPLYPYPLTQTARLSRQRQYRSSNNSQLEQETKALKEQVIIIKDLMNQLVDNGLTNNSNGDLQPLLARLDSLESTAEQLKLSIAQNNDNLVPLGITEDGRLFFEYQGTTITLANLEDLSGLGGGGSGAGKILLQTEKTYYVRKAITPGNSGESETEAFASIEEALVVLSSKYEVANHLIIDLDTTHDLSCAKFPNFTGAGIITIKGNGSTITFRKQEQSTVANLSNWAGLTLNLENINFVKGDCTKFLIEGGKMSFKKVNFDRLTVECLDCRTTFLEDCETNPDQSSFTANRCTIELNKCKLISSFKDCQIILNRTTFYRSFTIENSIGTLLNPRFNNRYFTVTANIIGSIIEFKSSWLTFQNLSNGQQNKPLIAFQNCTLKDFPSNIDLTSNRSFKDVSIIKLINCFTPEKFPNASFDLSDHEFIDSGT